MWCQASTAFEPFGRPHLTVMVLTVVVPLVLAAVAAKSRSPRPTRAICWILAAMLVGNELVYYAAGVRHAGWGGFVKEYLPLHICGAALYLAAVALVTRNRLAFELAYFWGLAGTLQAVITPDLNEPCPQYWFFQYFIRHSGIVVSVLFAVSALKLRPRRGAVLRVFWLSNAFLVVVAVCDWLLGANYMYLREAPDVGNPLLFLPWPWYILFLEGVALVLFALLALPFVRLRGRAAD